MADRSQVVTCHRRSSLDTLECAKVKSPTLPEDAIVQQDGLGWKVLQIIPHTIAIADLNDRYSG
jgi:hypothetical protein